MYSNWSAVPQMSAPRALTVRVVPFQLELPDAPPMAVLVQAGSASTWTFESCAVASVPSAWLVTAKPTLMDDRLLGKFSHASCVHASDTFLR
jgi:hypothetical protein